MSFGYVVDFRCAPKDALGGTMAAPTRLGEGAELVPDASCTACAVCGLDTPGCIGVVTTPLPASAQRWLCEQLPGALETLAGEVIKKALETGFSGARVGELRKTGQLGGGGPFERSWGSFFRRLTVSSDFLLEQMFCAGDLDPSHALALLVQLGALAVDGQVPRGLDQGTGLSEVAVAEPAVRRARTHCTASPEPSDEPAISELKGFLRALHAAFVVDAKVLIVED